MLLLPNLLQRVLKTGSDEVNGLVVSILIWLKGGFFNFQRKVLRLV